MEPRNILLFLVPLLIISAVPFSLADEGASPPPETTQPPASDTPPASAPDTTPQDSGSPPAGDTPDATDTTQPPTDVVNPDSSQGSDSLREGENPPENVPRPDDNPLPENVNPPRPSEGGQEPPEFGDDGRREERPPERPPMQIPPGCREEREPNGFVRVVCDTQTQCPPPQKEQVDKCMESGGHSSYSRSPNGCEVFSCQFTQTAELQGGVFKQYSQCPSQSDTDAAINKCQSNGLRGVMFQRNGCSIVECIGERQNRCPQINQEMKARAESQCQGSPIIRDYDGNGCEVLRCAPQNQCRTNIDQGAYAACESRGGEMITNQDNNGCITFAQCVTQGDDTDIYVERPTKELDSGELLSLAFKLENLAVQLDTLSKQSDDIATYYASSGEPAEKRFRRVSDMFLAAKSSVQDIKDKVRSRLDTLSVDDMVEVKQDLRYIKDVVIKDIVYVMLSSDSEIESAVEEGKTKDCGTNGQCFDRAFRICAPVKFLPEGRSGPAVEVTGLEGNACVLKATMFDQDMTCKIEKYALGVRDPETDILTFCVGPLLESLKTQGLD
ncbi:MAG: hypothetical protein HY365_00375, partial [Candidatus Aenigmarchaeota archaeon]|nr:hypothetical protein [Candidatus Aenigmarchaeota archaeon]